MTKILKFIKLSERWFVDIPWKGSVDDLQMVSGADTLIESLSDDNSTLVVEISTEPIESEYKLKLSHDDEFGAYYKVWTFEMKNEIWLCNVTKHVFGEFPKELYIKLL